MAVAERGAAEAAQRIADAFEAAAVPYAIRGALALAVAGVPRGTADVDVNVFVPEDRVGDVVDALRSLGIDADPQAARARAHRDGMFVARWDGMRIDVFLPCIPFAEEAGRTRTRITDDAAGAAGSSPPRRSPSSSSSSSAARTWSTSNDWSPRARSSTAPTCGGGSPT